MLPISPISYKKIFHLLLLVGSFLVFDSGEAQTKTNEEGGNWSEIVWDPVGNPSANDAVLIINQTVIIPEGETVEVGSINIDSGGELIVNGNLKVNGDFIMKNNALSFSMGPNSAVVIFGNLEAKNNVQISLSSFLLIYGNFNKSGNYEEGEVTIDEGDIYVYGDVGGTALDETIGCPDGTTPAEGEECGYGDEQDFEEDFDDLPPDVIDLVNCFDLSDIAPQDVCIGQAATFSVFLDPSANYQWQTKNSDGVWTNLTASPTITIGEDVLSEKSYLTFEAVTPELSGSQFRVVATPRAGAECTKSTSRTVTLTVTDYIWIGVESDDWIDPLNWKCGELPTSSTNVVIPLEVPNYPLIKSGVTGFARDLTLKAGASLIVEEKLNIAGTINSPGSLDSKAGTIEFNGISAQSIPPGAFLDNHVENLIVNNAAGLTLEGEILLTGTLTAATGDLRSNGNLTLVSDANQTALISGSGTGEVVGEVTMQRYLDPAYGYKYFSSPFENSTVADFVPFIDLVDPVTNFPHFYKYVENREYAGSEELEGNRDLSGWEPYIEPTGALNLMEGYAVNFGENTEPEIPELPELVSLTGVVNNGAVSKTLANNLGEYTKGFHLVGNPYPSPIDWNVVKNISVDIDDAVYFFTAGSTDPYTGTYTSYVDGVSQDGRSSNIIPSMQGFFVKVSDGSAEGTLTMNNSARKIDFNQAFLKSAETEEDLLVRISARFHNEALQDPTVIYFKPTASASFDSKLDALKLMNTSLDVPNLYSLSPEDKELSISALPINYSEETESIPLGIRVARSGEVSFQLEDITKTSGGVYVYLLDLKKRTAQELIGSEIYSTQLQAGTYNSRFQLVISKSPIREEDQVLQNDFTVISSQGKVVVHFKMLSDQEGELLVSNLRGQVIERRKAAPKTSIEIEGIKSSGIYIFSLITGEEVFSRKVLIEK